MCDNQRVVTGVTAEYDRALLFKSNEGKIVTLQSHVRGTIARKAYKERLDFIRRQLPAIIRIQVRLQDNQGMNSSMNIYNVVSCG